MDKAYKMERGSDPSVGLPRKDDSTSVNIGSLLKD